MRAHASAASAGMNGPACMDRHVRCMSRHACDAPAAAAVAAAAAACMLN